MINAFFRNLWLLGILLILPGLGWSGALLNPWAEVRTPAPGPVRVIGAYNGGCLQGAVSLLPDEGTFELMRKSRRHYFAHPQMRRFVVWLAGEVQQRGYGKLLVGDLGQPRGGPTTSGHASHQLGLDGDFWFWLDASTLHRPLSVQEEENLSAPSMLNPTQTSVDPTRLKDKQIRLLELVSGRPEVERIFVNPLIKKALCERTGAADWLRKVRPWWGHHYHFHVRLACPLDQPECQPQAPPAESAGCDAELDWWLSPEALEQARKNAQGSHANPEQRLAAKLARVPNACGVVLHPRHG